MMHLFTEKGVVKMYYSNGNYEAFARPKKPAGVDKKHAYIIGGGLAGLSAAVFLIRDAQIPGENIHILEELPVAGGSLDGEDRPGIGFVTRGGRGNGKPLRMYVGHVPFNSIT